MKKIIPAVIIIISLIFLCFLILVWLGLIPLKRWRYEQRARKLGKKTRARIQNYNFSRYTTAKAQSKRSAGWGVFAIVPLTVIVFVTLALAFYPDNPKASTSNSQKPESPVQYTQNEIQSNFVNFSIPECGYIINGSEKRLIDESELLPLSENACWIALDEIYARHGRMFTVPEIKEYFEALSWYHGTIDGASFDQELDKYLNSYEIKNIDIIVQYMRNSGWRQ